MPRERDTCCYSVINVRNFHEIGCWNFVGRKQREEFDMEDMVEKRQLVEFHRTCLKHEVVTIGRVRGIIWTGFRDNTIFRARRFPATTSRVFIEFRDVRGGCHGTSCAVTVDNAVKNKSSVRGVSYRGLENENEFAKPSTFHSVILSPPSFS